MDEKKIREDIEKLTSIDKEAEETLREKDFEKFKKLFSEFVTLRKQIRLVTIDTSVVQIDDPKIRNILQKMIANERVFFIGAFIASLQKSKFPEAENVYALSEEEIEQLGSDYFHSWFGSYEYVVSLYEIESLIVGIPVPDDLKRFVSEIRSCYAFQQYNAVYSLCRTVLEVAMRDIGLRTGKISRPKNDREFYWEYPPRKLIKTTSEGKLRGEIHKLYDEFSSLIHGNKTIKSTKARTALKKTLVVVQELYDSNLEVA